MKSSPRKFLLILFLLLIISQHSAGKEPDTNSDSAFSQQALKILSWNIYMLPHLDFKNANKLRAEALAKELSQTDYTILVFQEAFDKAARKRIREVLQKNFPYFYGPANTAKWYTFHTSSGLWIASKIPLHEVNTIRFEAALGADRFANKGAILLEGEWQKKTFQLVVTHIQSDDFPWSIREKQLKDIHQLLLQPYSKESVPQIICGDLNTDRAIVDNYYQMLTIMGAEDGSLSGQEQFSFSSEGNNITSGKSEKPRLIDYILIRNQQTIQSISRRIAIIQHYWSNTNKWLSDHNAIEATIRFSEEIVDGAIQP